MTSFLRTAAVLVVAPALASGAIAQDGGSQSTDMMTVYLPSADGAEAKMQEMSLEEASEACGVDMRFIEAWAASEPRYCVAIDGETDSLMSSGSTDQSSNQSATDDTLGETSPGTSSSENEANNDHQRGGTAESDTSGGDTGAATND